MDIKLEKPKGVKKIFREKNIPYFGAAVLLCLVIWMIFKNHDSELRVDEKNLAVATASYGDFVDYMTVRGKVEPASAVQISPLEGGVVKEKIAEEGTMVKKGDPLIILGNNTLDLSILNAEAELAEKQNFLRNTQVTMEQERLSIKQDRLQLDMDLKRKKRTYMQNKSLYGDGLISREIMLQSREDYQLALNRQGLIVERQNQDSVYRKVQMDQMEESLNNMKRNMQLIRRRVGNLVVKSPISGEVGSLDIELGQSLLPGQGIGRINDLSSYIIEADVDEYYIDRVKTGLRATLERAGITYDAYVCKVYPDVKDGKFRADLKFKGKYPVNIRTGQTYYLNLQLGQSKKAVMVPVGEFYHSTGGKWIFVINEKERRAFRRNISIGRQNPSYYEVSGGLDSGEKVIVSSYESFGNNEVLILNK
ncbi:MAG: efflux RND transporter periplasmic adaptor subunit [Bacteroidales bacterium]|jgi:HlyD family secretion protein|nr:efflux RND transporter periplasmic adaptor subunit [Bacteroidales bacterium]